MRIAPISLFFNVNRNKKDAKKSSFVSSPSNFNKNLPYDTISFGENKTAMGSRSLDLGEVYLELVERQEKRPDEEIFPMGIRPYIESALKTMPTKSLQYVHQKYFAKFQEYETLDELRKNCSEFKDIRLPSEVNCKQIDDALALELIQYMYCDGHNLSQTIRHFEDKIPKNSYDTMNHLLDTLEIPRMHPLYTKRLDLSDEKYNTRHSKKLSKGQKKYLDGIPSPLFKPDAPKKKDPVGYRATRKNYDDAIILRKTYKNLLQYEKDKRCEIIPYSVRARLEAAVNSGESITLEDIHKEVYAPLENMKTIDEVKERFPEFAGLLPFDEIPPTADGKTLLNKIKHGNIDFGVKTPEEFTILLLKMYWRDSIVLDDLFPLLSEMSGEHIAYNARLFDTLGIIKKKRKYSINLKYSNKDAYYKMASNYTNSEKLLERYIEDPAQIYSMTDYETGFWNANSEKKEALMLILEDAYYSDDKYLDEINDLLKNQGAATSINIIDPTSLTKEQTELLQKYWAGNEAAEFSEKLKDAAKTYGEPLKDDRRANSVSAQTKARIKMEAAALERRQAIAERRKQIIDSSDSIKLYIPKDIQGTAEELAVVKHYFEKHKTPLPESVKAALDKAIEEGRNMSFGELNREVYAPLLKMTSMKDAREKFPEFADAKSINEVDFGLTSALKRVEDDGLIKKENLDIFSILFLKLYYHDFLTQNEVMQCLEKVFGYTVASRFDSITKQLDIPTKDDLYGNLLNRSSKDENYAEQMTNTILETNALIKPSAEPEKTPEPEKPIIAVARKVLDEKAIKLEVPQGKIARIIEKNTAPLGYYPEVRADLSLYEEYADLLDSKENPKQRGPLIPLYLEEDIEKYLGGNKNLLWVHNAHFEYLNDPNITLSDLKEHEEFKNLVTPSERGLDKLGHRSFIWSMQKSGQITGEDVDELVLKIIKYVYLNAATLEETAKYFEKITPNVTRYALETMFRTVLEAPFPKQDYLERLKGYMVRGEKQEPKIMTSEERKAMIEAGALVKEQARAARYKAISDEMEAMAAKKQTKADSAEAWNSRAKSAKLSQARISKLRKHQQTEIARINKELETLTDKTARKLAMAEIAQIRANTKVLIAEEEEKAERIKERKTKEWLKTVEKKEGAKQTKAQTTAERRENNTADEKRAKKEATYPFPHMKPSQKGTYIALFKILQHIEDIESGENTVILPERVREELEKAVLNKENISFFELNERAYEFLDKIENIDQLRQYDEFKYVKKFSEIAALPHSILGKIKNSENPDKFILEIVKMYYRQGLLASDIYEFINETTDVKNPYLKDIFDDLGIPEKTYTYSLASAFEGGRFKKVRKNQAAREVIEEKPPVEKTEKPSEPEVKKPQVKTPPADGDIYPYSLKKELAKYGAEPNLKDVAKKTYADLLTMKSLQEVKARYPEFRNVKPISELTNVGTFVARAARGGIPGSEGDKLVIAILALYYHDGLTGEDLAEFLSELHPSSSTTDAKHMIKQLNIPRKNTQYMRSTKCALNSKIKDINFDKENTMQAQMLKRIEEAQKTGEDKLVTEVENTLIKSYIENPAKIYMMSENESEYWSSYSAGRERLVLFLKYAYSADNQIAEINEWLKFMEANFVFAKDKLDPTSLSREQKNWLRNYWNRSANKKAFSTNLELALKDYNLKVKQEQLAREAEIAQQIKQAELEKEARLAQKAAEELKADIETFNKETMPKWPLVSKPYVRIFKEIMTSFEQNPRLIYNMPDEYKEFWQDNPRKAVFLDILNTVWRQSYGLQYSLREELSRAKIYKIKPEEIDPFGTSEDAREVVFDYFSSRKSEEREFATRFKNVWVSALNAHIKRERADALIESVKTELETTLPEDDIRAVCRKNPTQYMSVMPTSFFKDIEKFASDQGSAFDFTSTVAKNHTKKLFFDDNTSESLARKWASEQKNVANIINANRQALIALCEVFNRLDDKKERGFKSVEIAGYGVMNLSTKLSLEVNSISNSMERYNTKDKKAAEILAFQNRLINELVAMGSSEDKPSNKKEGAAVEAKANLVLNAFDILRENALKRL